jgi:acyl-CoA thioesterase FadM
MKKELGVARSSDAASTCPGDAAVARDPQPSAPPVVRRRCTEPRALHYDDRLSIHVGVAELSYARLRFGYHVCVEAGDRVGLLARQTILFAETCHCCIHLADGRPTRFPDSLRSTLRGLAPADD